MVKTWPVHPEGPRYGASLVFLPGLWASGESWRRAAGYFAHRGWEGTIVEVRDVEGGLEARVRAVRELVRDRAASTVLVGHDAGAWLALAVAREIPVRAVVLVSPLVPGAPTTRTLVWSWRLVWALLRRRRIAPPRGAVADAVFGEVSGLTASLLGAEDPRTVAAMLRRATIGAAGDCPALLVHGGRDPLVPPAAARRFASLAGTEVVEIEEGAHWLPLGSQWTRCVERVHRWLVHRLGEPLLELHAETMAERDQDDGEPT
jgi:pimeloyl-ACP methyl ester carboxylesterase